MDKAETRQGEHVSAFHPSEVAFSVYREDNEWLKSHHALQTMAIDSRHTSAENEPRCANRQQFPFQESGDLLRGFGVGAINTTEGFIEFLASPDSVGDSLVGLGPVLDNVVNYYGNHVLAGTTSKICQDANEAKRAGLKELAYYSKMPPETRGEIIGSLAAQFSAAEVCSDIVERPVTPGIPKLSESLEMRTPTRRRFKTGAGGDWQIINERPSPDVVQQTDWDSCVAACGEMLSNGRLKQADLFARLKEFEPINTPGVDPIKLPYLLGSDWISGRYTKESLATIIQRGPFAAELKDWTIPGRTRHCMGHTVVVDGIDESGLIKIRDPKNATRYEMMRDDFLRVWTGCAVFRKEGSGL